MLQRSQYLLYNKNFIKNIYNNRLSSIIFSIYKPNIYYYATITNKNNGILHPNVRQLLKIIHPDNFNFLLKSDNPKYSYYKQLSESNQRSLQNINSFTSIMKNYRTNLNTFIHKPEPISINLNIIIKNNESFNIKNIQTALQYPNANKHFWVKHSNSEMYMYHWRDTQLLDLLNRVHITIDGKLNVHLLPSDQELSTLQVISQKTKIPLPLQFQEPTITMDNQPDIEKREDLRNIPFEEQKEYELYKKLKEADLLWNQPEKATDLYSLLRKQNLKDSSHPRSPDNPINKKYGLRFPEPSALQLSKMLECLQIDFIPGTSKSIQKSYINVLKDNAKQLKLWEWYYIPIVIGAEKYSIIKHSILGLPMNFTIDGINTYLEKNLPVLQQNGEIFRKRLDVISEKMVELQDYLSLTNIKIDPLISYEKVNACISNLLESKELLHSYHLHNLSIRIINIDDLCFFSHVNGIINIPYNVTDKQLRKFLIQSKKLQVFANYRIIRSSIHHLKTLLFEKANIQSILIPDKVQKNTIAYQSILGRLLDYITNYAPYNTLEKMIINVKFNVDFNYKRGVFHLPYDFTPKQIDLFFTKTVKEYKQQIEQTTKSKLIPKIELSHLPKEKISPVLKQLQNK